MAECLEAFSRGVQLCDAPMATGSRPLSIRHFPAFYGGQMADAGRSVIIIWRTDIAFSQPKSKM